MYDASFSDSYELGNRNIRLIQQILGIALFRTANLYEDMYINTDLVFDSPYGPVSVSVRIRGNKWYKPEYKYEFTLCYLRHYGGDAEYQKIMGYGHDRKPHGTILFTGSRMKPEAAWKAFSSVI